jgi:hypothetical protein
MTRAALWTVQADSVRSCKVHRTGASARLDNLIGSGDGLLLRPEDERAQLVAVEVQRARGNVLRLPEDGEPGVGAAVIRRILP